MTLEEEGSMTEEAMNSKAPPQTLNNSTLPLTERLQEEEDWLDDGNDFADVYGNDFGEEDIDLMEEDDLLGEELRIENEKHLQINDSRIKRADGGATLEITDGSGSGKVVESTVDSKNKTPTKGASSSSDRFSGSSASMKKKRGSRSRSTFGVSLRQRKLKVGLGSPKSLTAGTGPNGSKLKQPGPSLSANQRKAQEFPMSNPWLTPRRASALSPPSLAAGDDRNPIPPLPPDPPDLGQYPPLSPSNTKTILARNSSPKTVVSVKGTSTSTVGSAEAKSTLKPKIIGSEGKT
ncbi:unnamed protein product, partial [Brassica napus]